MKKLNCIKVYTKHKIPQNFENFFHELLQNSQPTLKFLVFKTHIIFSLPNVELPNAESVYFYVLQSHNQQIENFDKLLKSILQNCENISWISVNNIFNSS
jgi:hypothetical protein